jgi:hypothetical protein
MSGLPRKINLLAHHMLIAAALARAKLASADHVQAAERFRVRRSTDLAAIRRKLSTTGLIAATSVAKPL